MPRFRKHNQQLSTFLGSWQAVRYRLRACSEHYEAFISSLEKSGDAPPEEERYQQDQALYGFFVTGLSAFESFYFCMYFMGRAAGKASEFRNVRSPRRINPQSVVEAFRRAFGSGVVLTRRMDTLRKDGFFKRWAAIRNVLAHRVAPGRIIYGSVAFGAGVARQATPSELKLPGRLKPLVLDRPTLQRYFQWLTRALRQLVKAADQFSVQHFS